MMKKQFKKTSLFTPPNEIACKTHLQVLYSAVENNHLEKARTIIETSNLDLNSVNSDGFSVLDLSVLNNNRSMTKMLCSYGATENQNSFTENVGYRLHKLLKLAETKVSTENIDKEGNKRISLNASNLKCDNLSCSSSTNNETEMKIWERRVKFLKRLLLGWNQIDAPNVPSTLEVGVNGNKSVYVKILEPINGPITTKFKVQWSTDANFKHLTGECEFLKWNVTGGTVGVKETINDLKYGYCYYFRGSCGNMKSWGTYKRSTPSHVTVSSWCDLNTEKCLHNEYILDDLCTHIQSIREKDDFDFTTTNNGTMKKAKRKNTLKNFFSYPFKFQKNLKRSIYFASVIYNEDKILVTGDDFLPVIEIDDSYPKTFNSDYYWISKVSHFWEGIKSLRVDLEQNISSTFTFRAKLLSSICEMQSALGLLNLGVLYYKPIRDQNGAIVITSIQNVKSQKDISLLNSRWVSVRKIRGSSSFSLEEHSISKKLVLSLQDQIRFHQNLNQQLTPGLYIGYLNMLCTVEQIKVIVPAQTPHVIPHCKVRDNHFLTAEEWHLIKFGTKSIEKNTSSITYKNCNMLSEVQILFCIELTNSIKKLFKFMDIKFDEHVLHRIYDMEVIELTKNISFIIICPTVELNSTTLEADLLLQRDDLLSINMNVFEIFNLYSYHNEILYKYVRLYSILETETILTTRSHREAFSSAELLSTKKRLNKLNEFTEKLNNVWNDLRWLTKVITFARNKNKESSDFINYILVSILNNNEVCIDFKHIFQNINERDSSTYKSISNISQVQHMSLTQHQSYRNLVTQSLDSTSSITNKMSMQLKTNNVLNPILNLSNHGYHFISSSHLKVCSTEINYSNSINSENSESVNIVTRSNCLPNCSCCKLSSTIEDNKINLKEYSAFCNCISYQNIENNGVNTKNQPSGIIQVFTAYNTGLASGTSLKLHVTLNTTAREVINLVVKQLNMAVVLRGSKGPIHEMNKLHTFCLVAVIGARERCLRDDFKPLKLQNPWKKGRLYVRKKTDLLAAIEHYCQISYIQ